MRYAFAILISIHGLIHLMGFVKAFYLTDIQQQVIGISKPIGSMWLVSFILFIVIAIQFLTHKKWFYLAIIAILLSQILIIMIWKDAKFGTIPNLIIFIVGMVSYSNYRFQKMVEKESTEIIVNQNNLKSANLSKSKLTQLPEVVQKWVLRSGVNEREEIATVRLKQKGQMRMKPNSNWMPFEAEQYFDVTNASFVWKTKVNEAKLINMVGSDKLVGGHGAMLIKLFGIFPVVNQSKTNQINTGAMVRYLAEMCWFPSAALNDYITWESIDKISARGTFEQNNLSVSGVFLFNEEGDLKLFKSKRYFGGSKKAKLENWYVEILSYSTFHGIRIPNKSKVTWQLEGDNFHWLTVEITELDYNPNELFQ